MAPGKKLGTGWSSISFEESERLCAAIFGDAGCQSLPGRLAGESVPAAKEAALEHTGLRPAMSLRRWVVGFLLHSALASVGASLVSFGLIALLPLGPTPYWEGTFSRALHDPFDSPFLGQIAVGLALGLVFNWWSKSKPATWAWVLPLCWLMLMVLDGGGGTYHPLQTWLRYVWTDFFSQNPGDGGLAQLMATVPFLSSVAYSIGAWLALRKHGRSAVNSEGTAGEG